MMRRLVVSVLGLVCLWVVMAWTQNPSPSPKPASPGPTPPPKITTAMATPPADADSVGGESQFDFDLYSWNTFVAMNWPADTTTCGPNLGDSILSGHGPVVWETYLDDSDVFTKPPATPSAWCPQASSSAVGRQAGRLLRLSPAVRALSDKTGVRRFLHHPSKVSRALAATGAFPGIDQAVGGVLTDQNGRFVRYEVRMNKDEYGFISSNTLWSKAGQQKYTSAVVFPVGPSSFGPTGSIELKAAWKVLSDAEAAGGRFYAIQAIVYNDDDGNPSPGPNPVTLGLVGLHIVHKTKSQPRWLWSTFEHVDNLYEAGTYDGKPRSFANGKCPLAPPYTANAPAPCKGPCCPPNTQTASTPSKELDPSGKPLNTPAQVTRVSKIEVGPPPVDLNAWFQKLLAGSVWANYQLIGTQWSGGVGPAPKPPFLANTTLETYNQGPVPPTDGPVPFPSPGYNPFTTTVSSSCLKCHSQATTAGSGFKSSADFSFLLGLAQ